MKLFEAANAKIVKMIYADFVANLINLELKYMNNDREDDDVNVDNLPVLDMIDENDLTDEQLEKVAKVYSNWIQDMVESNGTEWKGITLPSEVWETIESIAKEIAGDVDTSTSSNTASDE